MSDEVHPEAEGSKVEGEPKARKRKAKAASPKKKKTAKKVVDPLGDPSDGEGQFATGADIEPAEEVVAAAKQAAEDAGASDDEAAAKAIAEPAVDEDQETGGEIAQAELRPAAKLERLQKILAQAGVASRRHAEELITEGRVQVNGQVVTVLGSKADPERDHIRVDGKLLHGAERLRYFVLNKPRGYVTTVSDPEGRPTVMGFFSKLGERLYPVGRLDFQSEGLLLVTNDGALSNQLTRAASGVEKTYLVKVSGKPDEERLQALREGISIERGRQGEGKVRTAQARIRQIRPGENPWYEVVLIEGRNRELRKMFEEIGHHVEKIRRVGYGPLVLDVPPGKVRELDRAEVEALRRTAEGKLKPRRVNASHMLPKEAGIPAEQRESARGKKAFRKARFEPQERPAQRRDFGERQEGGYPKRGIGREGSYPNREGNRAGKVPDHGGREKRFEKRGAGPGGGFPERTGGAGGFGREGAQGRDLRRGSAGGGGFGKRGGREGGHPDRAGRTPQDSGRGEGGFKKRAEFSGRFRPQRSEARPGRFGEARGRAEPRREGGRRPERGNQGGAPERGRPSFRGGSERPARFDERGGQRGPADRRGESRPGFKGGAERGERRFGSGGGRRPGGGFGAGRASGGQPSRPDGGRRPGARNAGKKGKRRP